MYSEFRQFASVDWRQIKQSAVTETALMEAADRLLVSVWSVQEMTPQQISSCYLAAQDVDRIRGTGHPTARQLRIRANGPGAAASPGAKH